MSNLLKALAMPPFGYFAPWESKKPDDPSSASVPEQPDQLKVQFSVVAAGARTPKDLMAYVVPDQATHVEFFLHYTHTQFMQNIVGRLDETNRTNGKYLFELLPKCLQGAAVMAWKTVVDRFIFADADSPTADEFNEVVQHYLEEVAGLKYLKDAALRFLLNSKKPMEMSPLHFFRRRSIIMGYVEGGLLRGNCAIPTQVQLNEAAFLGCSKSWQERFAETHEEVPADQQVLAAAFSAYHAADVRNGTLKKLKKEKESSKKDKVRKTSFRPSTRFERRPHYRPDHEHRPRDPRDDRSRRDYPRSGHDQGKSGHSNKFQRHDGGKGKPYKRTPREEAHHNEEERSASRSRSRDRSRSSSRGRSRSASPADEQYHNEYGSRSCGNVPAKDAPAYSDSEGEEDPRKHRGYRDNKGYLSFDAPANRGKRT